jgi:DNA polymerase III delta prime subunit
MADNHAFLVLAPDIRSALIPERLKSESADVRHLVIDNFGIDDARKLKEMTFERSFSGGDHDFVVCVRSLTIEAQNAILKLFEDPPAGTVFHLIVPSASILLPTLRSRLLSTESGSAADRNYADDFCQAEYKERVEWIADKAKKDPQALVDLVRELGQEDLTKNWPIEAKRALSLALRYVYNRGASKKMLLEELALSLPVER